MRQLREKLARFMIGRYGIDQLGSFLNHVLLLLVFGATFLVRRSWGGNLLGLALYFGVAALFDHLLAKSQGYYYQENREAVNVVMILIAVLGFFLPGSWGHPLFTILELLTLGLLYARMFSRNTGARYKENEAFLRMAFHVGEGWKKLKFRFEEGRKYHIFKCPSCGQKIRIPRGHGRVSIHCPKCGTDFIKKS